MTIQHLIRAGLKQIAPDFDIEGSRLQIVFGMPGYT